MYLKSDNTGKELVKERLQRRCAVDERSGCWNWTGPVMANGYGVIRIRTVFNQQLVHRAAAFAWMQFNLAGGLQVCHHCDNRRCFNPEHLFLGTQQDNIDDMMAKNREPHYARKLNENKVFEIRVLSNLGIKSPQLAMLYGVTYQTVNRVVDRSIWNHVP